MHLSDGPLFVMGGASEIFEMWNQAYAWKKSKGSRML